MKLLSYITAEGQAAYGAVKGDGVVTLSGRLAAPTLRALLALPEGLALAAALVAARQPDVALVGLAYAPVIPDPDKIICVGLNYHDHVQETGRTVTANPALFARFAGSQIGHGQPLVRPHASNEFDYEAELAVIIGKGGRHIPADQALAHVAGYSCYNEGSIRDYQRHTSQFLAGKTFAGTGAFGPWMVTADEIPDPTALTLEGRLNGQVVQHTSVGQMITPIPQLIAYISTVLPLLPGDVIVSGTPGGVGAKRNPPLWMKPGDVAEIEVSGIGILRNPVVQEGST